jgi:ribosomal protein S18 acetylase RimI-like enzyme
MIPLASPFRRATPDDAPALAELINHAGHGLPLHFWTLAAAPGQDPWDLGRARQAARAEEGKIVVIDEGAGAIAALTGYAIGPDPDQPDADTPALFRPLVELEALAPRSWYVNVLACQPAHRGRGHGSRLLELAERIAAAENLPRMSVIVADDNAGARRLYERHGYRGSRPPPLRPRRMANRDRGMGAHDQTPRRLTSACQLGRGRLQTFPTGSGRRIEIFKEVGLPKDVAALRPGPKMRAPTASATPAWRPNPP